MILDNNYILFANAEIIYEGRAHSFLELGNYLIIQKQDKSIQIHGSSKIPPKNYQGPGSSTTSIGNIIISKNKKETITIIIHKVISYTKLNYWSDNKLSINRTEKELVDKLIHNWSKYFGFDCKSIETEAETKYGKIDILGTDFDNHKHIVEVKRKKINISNCTQAKRYVEALKEDYTVCGYLAAPSINDNALKYLDRHGFKFICVNWDD